MDATLARSRRTGISKTKSVRETQFKEKTALFRFDRLPHGRSVHWKVLWNYIIKEVLRRLSEPARQTGKFPVPKSTVDYVVNQDLAISLRVSRISPKRL